MRIALVSPMSMVVLCGCLLAGGCGAITVSTAEFKGNFNYPPTKLSGHIDAENSKIAIKAQHSLDPVIEGIWTSWGNNQQSIENYRNAVAQVEAEFLVKSGLFTKTFMQNLEARGNGEQAAGNSTLLSSTMMGQGQESGGLSEPAARALEAASNADFTIDVKSEESRPKDFKLTLKVAFIDNATQTVLKFYERESDLGDSTFSFSKKLEAALQDDLISIEEDMIADFSGKNLHDIQVKNAHLDPGDLDKLLVAKDQKVSIARERNRELIAAKTLTLPGLLQNDKTAQLVDLSVKFEQVMFDLEHEAQLARDRAQADAANGTPAEGEQEWSLIYRERIEILKPMLSAIKDEIANRGR
jgi:hypothetical protein